MAAGVVALDCEMVGVKDQSTGSMEDALCRVSVVALQGHEAYKLLLDTWVLVNRDIVDFRSAITGLGAKSFQKKTNVSFATARARVAALIAGKIVVGHALWNDFKVLQLHHPESMMRDTALYLKLRPPWRSDLLPSLNLLAHYWLGNACQAGVHDSVADATTALRIYELHAVEWEVANWTMPDFLFAYRPFFMFGAETIDLVKTASPVESATLLLAKQAPAKSGGWPLGLLDQMQPRRQSGAETPLTAQ